MSLISTAAATAGTASRKRGPWVIAGAVTTVLAIALGGLVILQWLGRPSEQRETQQWTYPLQAANIVIDAKRGLGDIVVLPGGTGEVAVEREVTWDREKPVMDVIWADGRLQISVDCPADLLYETTCEVTHTIRVPTGTRVDLASDVGDVKIKDIRGDLRVDSGTGDLEVAAATGALVVRVGTGDATLTGLRVREADLSLDTGDLRSAFIQAPQRVTANVHTGTLDIDVPNDGGYRIEAVVETGGRTIDLRQQSGATRTIIARVDTGELRLR